MTAHWTLDDIDWDAFEPAKVDEALVKLIKAASLVEHNGAEYTRYLCDVFAGDDVFQSAIRQWGQEEVQHGKALARWARLADPTFDFDAAFERFLRGYSPFDDGQVTSTRGSRTGELIARCIVETGTSSYYTALAETAGEPVLCQICRKIAADEFRHYKLFYQTMKRYQVEENLGRVGRLRVALGRLGETEDDELAYAYYAANDWQTGRYDREAIARIHIRSAFSRYRRPHVMRAAAMMLKAAGLPSNGMIARIAGGIGWKLMQRKAA